ncbi:hypothetical protein HDU96_010812, partial [Phlyctochytrium bullatum]
ATIKYANGHDTITASVQLGLGANPANAAFNKTLGTLTVGAEQTGTGVYDLRSVPGVAVGKQATVRVVYTLHDATQYDCADVVFVA